MPFNQQKSQQGQSQQQGQPMGLRDQLAQEAIKEMKKQTKAATAQKLQAGQTPEEIILSLVGGPSAMGGTATGGGGSVGFGGGDEQQADPMMNALAQLIQQKLTPPSTSDKLQAGLTVLTAGLIPTPGYAKIANQRKNPLNISDLTGIMNLQNNLGAEQRRIRKDERQDPIDKANLKEKQLNILKETGDPQLAATLGVDPDFATKRLEKETSTKQRIQSQTQILTDARKGLNDFTVATSRSLSSIDKIENAAIELGQFEEGFFKQVGAKTKATVERFRKTPQYVKFQAVINQELANISRNVGGEKGAIAEGDIDRVRVGFGEETLPIEQKIGLLDELRSPLFDELDTRIATAEVDPKKYSQKFSKITQTREKVTKRIEQRMQSRVITALQAKQFGADEYDPETGEYFSQGKVIGRSR